jgi:competence protein ComEC
MLTADTDAAYTYNSQLGFDAHQIQASKLALPGRIQVSGFGSNAVYQGDIVQVSGKVYPGRGQYQARISYAQMRVIARGSGVVPQLRRKFTAGMQTALPEPQASFAMGLLIGQRSNLPADIKQSLLMVGLTHIIAVSGYNLTIMLEAGQRLFGRRSKRLSTLAALGLIAVFLMFTGFSASIVRAAIVSMLSIWAIYYGRQFNPLLLILLAAAITAFAKPTYLWSDLSWYLSFLAFYGVLVLAPLIKRNWSARRRRSLLLGIALESICAELMTLPFVLHSFGQMPLIGLPANVLVVTVIPLAMFLSLVAGLAGMLFVPLTGWLALPAKLLLTYMLDCATLLSRLPHIFLRNLALSVRGMLILYLSLVLLSIVAWAKDGSR